MKNTRQFLRCDVCGNLVGVIEDSGVKMICCGQEMTELTANTTDAAQEKHVPVATRNGDQLTVKVGSVPHPMLEEHHISWIVLAEGDRTQRVKLDPLGAPEATFCLSGNGAMTVYEYCNLHGLWAADVNE